MSIVVVTPTSNRRWSWEFSKACMLTQTQKPTKWIVVDNSTHDDYDWSVSQSLPFVEYHQVREKKTIGDLRNICLEKALEAGAEYIVFWDDDDYYPPTRISVGVKALKTYPECEIAASSRMYILLTKENVFMEVGPYGPNHGTAATYTVRRRYAETHRFPSTGKGEELAFTKQWTTKMVQVPAEETIVVMGHSRNTVDKSDLYTNPQVFKGNVLNTDNGKMVVRARWPIRWDLLLSTFFGGKYAKLRENTPKALSHSVMHPNLHIEETGVSGERRV
jgi:glycosyltransferase involved in cell wall biosynthesis